MDNKKVKVSKELFNIIEYRFKQVELIMSELKKDILTSFEVYNHSVDMEDM